MTRGHSSSRSGVTVLRVFRSGDTRSRSFLAASCRGLASCFGLRGALPPKLCATLRSCRRCGWLCASWSAGTTRRRRARIDRPVYMPGGACYCGVLCSSRACAVLAASTSSAASGRCSRLYTIARPCVRSFAPPSCSLRAAPVASLRLYVHPSSARLQLRDLGVTEKSWPAPG